ncbi:MAG: efflux RND transporter periplasmic adaptor subunit [Robiginitomaculum sp.]|nr:efflux RND transporter periplasmic adaptor subunit [Robiginitomaculum sp.]
MRNMMKTIWHSTGFLWLAFAVLVYSNAAFTVETKTAEQSQEDPQKGPNRGRLLQDDGFVVELAVFEIGVPPEFRVWVTNQGQPVNPNDVLLTVTLTRLGGIKDIIKFQAQGDFLRGDGLVYEPHSFVVAVDAKYRGRSYQWRYDNFEGRTFIEPDVAKALEITTSIAGSAILKETIAVFGKLTTHPEHVRNITARFEGSIKRVHVGLGQAVKKGQKLITIESNESLQSYTITTPISGIVQQRIANPGEQTNARVLLSIVDTSVLMADLSVFPTDRHRVFIGATAQLFIKGHELPVLGTIKQIDTVIARNQSVIVRAQLDNKSGKLIAGAFVKAEIEIAEHQVPLAVKRTGLQGFRDFTVVFVKIGNEYEVRMLDLGRVAADWIEVLGGLTPGAEYVSQNSYIIKADIEKSGASHDH